MDLRGETGFAGIAGGPGGGGVTLVADITGLPGTGPPGALEGSGAILAARTGLPDGAPGAAEGAGGLMVAGTTALPATGSPGAVEGGGPILAARTLALRAAGSRIVEIRP